MNNLPGTILYRKAALIFEELGFLMPRPDNGVTSESQRTTAIVFFKGPFSGFLQVSLNSGLLKELSNNMLGDEPASGSGYEQDSLREIANVICGNALPAIFGSEPVFHLDAPKLSDEQNSAGPGETYRKIAQAAVSFDCGHAEVALYADKASEFDAIPS